MKLIQPNCRVQFAAEDITFILSVLSGRNPASDFLVQLLADQDSRDAILDDEHLFRALLEHGGCVRVSTRFYFYILIRHAFLKADIHDREVADYVAEVLSEFALSERASCVVPGQQAAAEYLVDMISALQVADDRTGFTIRAHIGNYSLFLAGVFPDRIRFRNSRGFPDLKYYEGMGRAQYRMASDHRLAQRYDLADIFATLAERFETTRRALNDVADRLLCLGDPGSGIETLLKRSMN